MQKRPSGGEPFVSLNNLKTDEWTVNTEGLSTLALRRHKVKMHMRGRKNPHWCLRHSRPLEGAREQLYCLCAISLVSSYSSFFFFLISAKESTGAMSAIRLTLNVIGNISYFSTALVSVVSTKTESGNGT